MIHDEDQSGVPCWTQVTTKALLVVRFSHRPHSRVQKGVRLRYRGHPHDSGGGVHRLRTFLAEPHSLAAMFTIFSHGLND